MPDSFFASSKPRKRKRSASDGPKQTTKTPASKSSAKPSQSRPSLAKGAGAAKKTRRSGAADEELDSDRTNDDGAEIDDLELRPPTDEETSGDEFQDETPAEKRLRLAKLYLESVKEDLADGEFDAAEIDKELISARLKQDVLEHSGKVHLYIAGSFDFTLAPPSHTFRGHRFSVTSATASESGTYLFTAGKEGSIIKWDLATASRLHTFHKHRRKSGEKDPGEVKAHTDEVLALAISGDGKYLASAGKDRRILLWNIEKNEWVKGFGGHKDTISALSFRKGTNQLYTASYDRTLKLFDMSEGVMGYVETLFGHQDTILGLDALRAETTVSAGGRDKTVRFWKIVQETQLVFRGGGRSRLRDVLDGGLDALDERDEMVVDGEHTKGAGAVSRGKSYVEGSIECVSMIDESTFVSGGDSGSIALWTTSKKKPIFTHPLAHGLHSTPSSTEGLVQNPRWVTSLASLRYSDLFASGSWDQVIRLWKLSPTLKDFSALATIAAHGVVNSLQFITSSRSFPWATDVDDEPSKSTTTTLLVAGLGQEHRLGRWLQTKQEGGKNVAVVFALRRRPAS